MGPKVSMVMPCYNKVDYIGEMLSSVLSQKWDHIELIIVNDGSTDGSYEIALDYMPKMREKGYECVIINQKNAGCCATLRKGLLAVTGEYVCVVDSDDELDPYYVNRMVSFLEKNKDFDYAVCDKIEYIRNGNEKFFAEFTPREIKDDGNRMAELYMAGFINPMSWVYMVRTEYFKKCRIVETFVTDTQGSYEPGYNIPLLANRGKMKYFPLPLYHFQVGSTGHSRFGMFSQAKKFQDEYWRLCKTAIDALSDSVADKNRKTHLKFLACFYRLLGLMNYARLVSDGEAYEQKYRTTLLNYASEWLGITHYYTYDADKFWTTLEMIKNMVYVKQKFGIDKNGKIIGVAAKAKKAAEIIPNIKRTPFAPTELWDANADDSKQALYGIPLKRPDYESLCGNETVLILTVNRSAVKEILAHLNKRGVGNVILANAL